REEHAAALKRLQADQEQLRKAASSLQQAVAKYAEDAELLAVEVAFASVTRLLGDKSADRSLMGELCQRIVHEYGHPPATLRVSEADMPLLASIELGIPVEADRRLAPGQCVIDTARGQFESGLDVRLEALRRTLLATLAEHRGQA
ncbi:MAG TPA: FliH/SctL family protein, partial [Xanthomonadaceae bacterium]|nr:FliH/SctL family protein [Xanthomonadaceae bacterium]